VDSSRSMKPTAAYLSPHIYGSSIPGTRLALTLDLHDLVARRKGPAEPFHLAIAGGIERGLQLNIKGACSDTAAVHV
jgi:hypothetical protein